MTSSDQGFYVRTFLLVAVLLGVVGVLAAYAVDVPNPGFEYVLRAEIRRGKTVTEVPEAARAGIAEVLTERFGTPREPRCDIPGIEMDEGRLRRGQHFYFRNCMHCHGVSGDGDGPTARYLDPRPRDYRLGIFKFTSTASGSKPTREDLRRTLLEGMPGTMMPSFALYAAEDVDAVLDYVILLSMRGETEEFLAVRFDEEGELDPDGVEEDLETIVQGWADATGGAVAAPAPAAYDAVARSGLDAAAVARARAHYEGAGNCVSCHGPFGKGDGPTAPTIDPDDWGNRIRPADLTRGVFRGGNRPIDVFRRIYAGVKGTPMPGIGDKVPPEEMWELVHYVRSLSGLEAAPASGAGG